MTDAPGYRQLLQSLLPPGAAFNREDKTTLGGVLLAIADELARIDANVALMLREAYPLTAFELLADWERVTGLPDDCGVQSTTLAERRNAVAQRLGTIGGQSVSHLIYVAGLLGFTITIEEFRPFTTLSTVDGRLYDENWSHVFLVRAPSETIRYLTTEGVVSEALASWGNELLECLINRIKPAHTYVIFAYGENE